MPPLGPRLISGVLLYSITRPDPFYLYRLGDDGEWRYRATYCECVGED